MQYIQSKDNNKFNSKTIYAIDEILLTNEGISLYIVDIYQTFGTKLVRYSTLEDFYKDWKVGCNLYILNKT